MTVYVDRAIHRWRGQLWCHLFADTEEELHEFGKRIGMRRAWFQSDVRLPHYDINRNRRRLAVEAGAVEVDFRFVACRIQKNVKASQKKRAGKTHRQS